MGNVLQEERDDGGWLSARRVIEGSVVIACAVLGKQYVFDRFGRPQYRMAQRHRLLRRYTSHDNVWLVYRVLSWNSTAGSGTTVQYLRP